MLASCLNKMGVRDRRDWRTGFVSEVGKRSVNMDATKVISFKERGRWFHVLVSADGIGSRKGSEECSKELTNLVAAALSEFSRTRSTVAKFSARDLNKVKSHVFSAISKLNFSTTQGTVFSAALVTQQSVLTIHTGDCGVSVLTGNGEFHRLTCEKVDDEGAILTWVDGAGNLHGDLSVSHFNFDDELGLTITFTDGVSGSCSNDEFRKFCIYCAANAKFLETEFPSFLNEFVAENASDNFSASIVCKLPKKEDQIRLLKLLEV